MYKMVQEGDNFTVYKDDIMLRTPQGSQVCTKFEPLATKLLGDLMSYGEDPSDPISLVAFHYAMIDFFAIIPREELERNVALGLEQSNDWTFNCPSVAPETMMPWYSVFGTYDSNYKEAIEWLKTLTRMQLCAVCVIGRALESVNIPFIAAHLKKARDMKVLVDMIHRNYPYVGKKDLKKYLDNYMYYFRLGERVANG